MEIIALDDPYENRYPYPWETRSILGICPKCFFFFNSGDFLAVYASWVCRKIQKVMKMFVKRKDIQKVANTRKDKTVSSSWHRHNEASVKVSSKVPARFL